MLFQDLKFLNIHANVWPSNPIDPKKTKNKSAKIPIISTPIPIPAPLSKSLRQGIHKDLCCTEVFLNRKVYHQYISRHFNVSVVRCLHYDEAPYAGAKC